MKLNDTEKRIAKFIATGDQTQAQIARRLGVSRQYVNQTVKKLLKADLIRQSATTPGKTDIWYEAADLVDNVTACRVHNIIFKYPIMKMNGDLILDPVKTGYFRSWKPRGEIRHKFFMPSSGPNSPNITIDYHPMKKGPGTLIVYPDAHQTILAPDLQSAEARILLALDSAVAAFCVSQDAAGCDIVIARPCCVSNPHYAFKISKQLAEQGTYRPGWWVDQSEGHEVETDIRSEASALDRGINRLISHDEVLEKLAYLIEIVESQRS